MRLFNCLIIGLMASMPMKARAETMPEPAALTDDEIQAAVDLGVAEEELFQVSDPLPREDRERLKAQLEREFRTDQRLMAQRTDQALDRLVRFSAWTLKRKGFRADAEQLESEYETFYTNAVTYLYDGVVPTGLGDHKPLNQWLADWHDKIEARLGEQLCKMLHIHDLEILNYGIPVVFKPSSDNLWCVETLDATCQEEYKVHAAGIMTGNWTWDHHGTIGVITYWVSWGFCVGATFGAGALPFICMPIATVIEMGMDKYVSPRLSDAIYCRVNGCN